MMSVLPSPLPNTLITPSPLQSSSSHNNNTSKKSNSGKARRRKKKGRHTSSSSFHTELEKENGSAILNDGNSNQFNHDADIETDDIDIEYIPEDFAPEMEHFFKSVVDRFQAPAPSSDLDFDLPSNASDIDMESPTSTHLKKDKFKLDKTNILELDKDSQYQMSHEGKINLENTIHESNKENQKENKEKDHEQGGEKEEEEEEEEEEQLNLSKRKLRKERRLTVAELKQLVEKPEVVEWVDICAADPKLLVDLKSTRNVVPIPIHWSQKRKYLQNKRGIEKPPFELPEFIRATGIQNLREMSDKPDTTLKQKTRERVQPKMGKLVIDYAKLHDAFFKWQTKPEMTNYGEMYYEGREYETKLKNVRPGAPLSEELKEALNMPPLAPPPWLINMQRFGPPPSYPGLKIPGLNAPIPNGAQWGFHPGGWGKPPVDEYGRPLYGDVFGTSYDPHYVHPYAVSIQKELWGELPPEREEEENGENEDEDEEDMEDGMGEEDEDEEGSEEDMEIDVRRTQGATKGAAASEGMLEIAELTVVNRGPVSTAAGQQRLQSLGDDDEAGMPMEKEGEEEEEDEDEDMEIEEFVAGLETPAIPADIELRKTQTTKPSSHSSTASQMMELPTTSAFPPPSLYTILPEKKVSVSGMMGSERIYDLRGIQQRTDVSAAKETSSSTPSISSSTTPSTLLGQKDEKKKKAEEKKKKEFKF